MGQNRPNRQRSWWGWGWADEQAPVAELRQAAAGVAAVLGFGSTDLIEPVPVTALQLPEPRLQPPPVLRPVCSTDPADRARHAYGRAYRDLARAVRGRVDNPPDVVARPRSEDELAAVLSWCAAVQAAAIPFGGGTSVVGGVEPRLAPGYAGAVTIDLAAFDRLLEVDPVSRAARVQAGMLGPALEEQLAPHGLTLRHFPQSFELSTVGGWLATRAAGHFSTRATHIEDLVESVRAVTPVGVWQSRRLPGSGAGPSPDRLLVGSEGTLGVITEAWLRVRPRPRSRRSASLLFDSFEAAVDAARTVVQDDLDPATCRVVDAQEAALTGAGDGTSALLLLGFEAAERPVDAWLQRGVELCVRQGGRVVAASASGTPAARAAGAQPAAGRPTAAAPTGRHRRAQDRPDQGRTDPDPAARDPEDPSGAWRAAFLRAPYLRDLLVMMGVLVETFETAITWERFAALQLAVRAAAEHAVRAGGAEPAGASRVTCRVTHVYPDGLAPYFTVLAPARTGAEVEQWDTVKRAVTDAVLAAGGSVTHHHAVGRDHRPWYDRQRPEPFGAALRAAKHALDPAGILNPGVLLDP